MKIGRSLLGSAALRVTNAILGFGVAAVLARTLGAEGFGLYSSAFVIASVCAIVVQFGIPNLVMRETATAAVSENWARMRAVWGWAGRGATVFSLAIVVFGIIVLSILGRGMEAGQLWTYALALGLVPLLAFGALRGGALRGLQHVMLAQLPEMVVKPGVMLGLALMLGLVVPATASSAMAMQLAATGVAFGVGAITLWRKTPAAAAALASALGPGPMPSKSTIVSFALVAGSTQVNQYLDILTLTVFRSDTEVGLYRAAWQLSLLVGFGTAVGGAIFPALFARYHAERDRKGLVKALNSARLVALAPALPLAGLCFLMPGNILSFLFGPEFAAGALVLVIFAALRLILGVAGPLGPYLNMIGKEQASGRAHLMAAGANICLNIALVPSFGGAGAAVATAVSYIFLCTLLISRTRRF
ncbi:polysaccharide biosynthesis C-terminal domain-containing protein [Rhodothalassium salexigens]|nr:polysaccharide biosynthesis C-terminal domain-containing protein [Rhodothalassium salexigens]MBB4212447.1 O-antigen/teichoic acid export membrane protein [Rhodothalassium salexigens DSM 2132]